VCNNLVSFKGLSKSFFKKLGPKKEGSKLKNASQRNYQVHCENFHHFSLLNGSMGPVLKK
jgi:hypothetical protein